MSENKTNENWSLIIKPKRSLFDVNLKELWKYRDLIGLFVRRDFVARYKQTVLGPLWFLIQPLLSTLMYVVVFGNIAKIDTDGLPKILFYMSGIVGWTYFATALKSTSNTFVANAGIFGKVYFPRLALPISTVISGLVQFVIQFVFLLCFIVYYHFTEDDFTATVSFKYLLIPVLVLLMAGLGLGFGILISAMTTKYRDLTNLVGFGVQLWMYVTPVVYPISVVPEKYKIFILANPLTPVIETFKFALLGKGNFDPLHLLYSFGFMIVLLVAGVLVFNKVEQSFMDTV